MAKKSNTTKIANSPTKTATGAKGDIAAVLIEKGVEILIDVVSDRIPNKKDKSPKNNHGPLVKTGPTSGKNRSRNKNGQWRAKRSDAGIKRK